MSSPQTPPKALLEDISKASESKSLKHVEPKENQSLIQSKVLLGVTAKPELKHVEKPADGLSEAAKQNFINKVKDDEE